VYLAEVFMRYLLLLSVLIALPVTATGPLRIAVAANFRGTLQGISELFQQQTGHTVVLSSASTGVLYTQILQGAPFDLFFSADRETALKLASGAPDGTMGEPFCYARGRLVLAGDQGDLASLGNPRLSMAIANPATAPYGRAAMDVLARPEFSDGIGRKLVRGSNVVQAYQFWYSGATDLALVPAALSPGATPIPANWHQPLEQFAIALTPQATRPALVSYLNWIRSDTVRSLIIDAGYEPCP